VLLFLPLRLLFDTSYSDQDPNGDENNVSDLADSAKEKELMTPMDYRKLKRCPNLQYKDRLMSVFLSDYDENCMYKQDEHDDDEGDDDDDSGSEEEEDSREDEEDEEKTCVAKRGIDEELKENAEEILKTRQMKSVTVAGHILVTMLLVSVIAALIEVLRIRFAREKVLCHILQKFLLLALKFSIIKMSLYVITCQRKISLKKIYVFKIYSRFLKIIQYDFTYNCLLIFQKYLFKNKVILFDTLFQRI